jgi:hypothetical protein
VPEPVGVHPAIDPGFARQARKQVADVGRVEAAALQRANRRPGAGPEASPTIEPAREQRRDLLGDLSPLPWRTRIVPAGRSTSRNSSARASEIRRPQRHSTTISARLRIPVDARELQARISAIASGSESTSGGRRRGLEDEPGAAEASVTIVSLRRELDQQLVGELDHKRRGDQLSLRHSDPSAVEQLNEQLPAQRRRGLGSP